MNTPSTTAVLPAEAQTKKTAASWPLSWQEGGWNGCVSQAARALRYLADKPRPSGGEAFPNSACCYDIASQLEKTQRELLVPASAALRAQLQSAAAPWPRYVVKDEGEGADSKLAGLPTWSRVWAVVKHGSQESIDNDLGERVGFFVSEEAATALRNTLSAPVAITAPPAAPAPVPVPVPQADPQPAPVFNAAEVDGDRLLQIARDMGLRSYLHGVNASNAKAILTVFVAQVASAGLIATRRIADVQEEREAFEAVASLDVGWDTANKVKNGTAYRDLATNCAFWGWMERSAFAPRAVAFTPANFRPAFRDGDTISSKALHELWMRSAPQNTGHPAEADLTWQLGTFAHEIQSTLLEAARRG